MKLFFALSNNLKLSTFFVTSEKGLEMTIGEGKFVDLSFKVFIFTENSDVRVYTKSNFNYFHPSIHFFKKVQKALVGAHVHERVIVNLEPHEAYGDYDNDLVFTVDRNIENGAFDPKIGHKFSLEMNDGRNKIGKVIFKDDNHIYLDTNHPLAGAKLKFDIYVKKISNTENKVSFPQRKIFEDGFNFR